MTVRRVRYIDIDAGWYAVEQKMDVLTPEEVVVPVWIVVHQCVTRAEADTWLIH